MNQQRRPYRPDLVALGNGKLEQRFTANVVSIEDSETHSLLAFGELVPDEGLPPEQGTPVHSLLITLPPAAGTGSLSERALTVELNEQGNDVDAGGMERIELGPAHLRIYLKGGLSAGRVSLSPEIEIYEDAEPDPNDELFEDVERFDDVAVSSICVAFQLDADRHASLTAALRGCSDLVPLICVEAAPPRISPRRALVFPRRTAKAKRMSAEELQLGTLEGPLPIRELDGVVALDTDPEEEADSCRWEALFVSAEAAEELALRTGSRLLGCAPWDGRPFPGGLEGQIELAAPRVVRELDTAVDVASLPKGWRVLVKVEVTLDADVLEGFCYGEPWARNLSAPAKVRVLNAIGGLYQRTVSVPAWIELEWGVAPDSRWRGPVVAVEGEPKEPAKRLVEEALRQASEELRFGDSSDEVIPALRAAATSVDER